MAAKPWDVIIVGQGIAGTTLAWHLHDAGLRVHVIDSQDAITSSKIAAGLITPITGKRMALTRNYDEFMPIARAFYTSIETQTGETFFHDRTAIRLFRSHDECRSWAERRLKPEFQIHLVDPQPEPLIPSDVGDSSAGGFAMHAAQLDVPAYLEASRKILSCEAMTIEWSKDVDFHEGGVTVGPHRTNYLISCEGYAATRNPHFKWVPFIAAKGDILTIRLHKPIPSRSIHRGIWMAPTSDPEVFCVGSTYDWDNLDQVPNGSGRVEIEGRLREFLHTTYTVLDHMAAVRPIISESKALIGFHPQHERLGYFNGLGSKGSLNAPWYARAFTEHLVKGRPLAPEIDVQQHYVEQ